MTTALVHTGEPPATALAAPNAQRAVRLLRPIAEPADVITAQDATRDLIEKALKDGRDYGKIPGVDKPSLLKPGAERVALAFGCLARFTIEEREIDHDREVKWTKRKKKWRNAHRGDREFTWEEEAGVSYGLYRYVVRCDLVDRSSDAIVGSCLGTCSTLESKYVDRPRDSENTALKMAEKRALVGAVLVTFGLSDQFTQDVEDTGEGAATAGAPAGAPTQQEQTPALTRDSEITWGKLKGKKIRELAHEYLEWAVEPGRKFGPQTDAWQKAMRIELELRESGDLADEERTDPTLPSTDNSHETTNGGSTRSTATSAPTATTPLTPASANEGGSFADYGEELPHGEPPDKQPIAATPANGAPDSVYALGKRFELLISQPEIPEELREATRRDAHLRSTKNGYAEYLATQIKTVEEVLAGAIDDNDRLAALRIIPGAEPKPTPRSRGKR